MLPNQPKLSTPKWVLPYNRSLVARAQELRKNMTVAEKKLWNGYLRNFQFRVLRQRPIDHFIVDFYCADLKLVIEVDGESHFTPEGQAHDHERTQILAGYGLQILRFTNDEVLQQFEGVCRRIAEMIPPSPPCQGGDRIGGLDCERDNRSGTPSS